MDRRRPMGGIQASGGTFMREKTKLIAETAWHHDGDFSFMEKLVVEILNKSRLDILKMHITLDFDEYMHDSHLIYDDFKNKCFSEKNFKRIGVQWFFLNAFNCCEENPFVFFGKPVVGCSTPFNAAEPNQSNQ